LNSHPIVTAVSQRHGPASAAVHFQGVVDLSLTVHTIMTVEGLRALSPEIQGLLARTAHANVPFLLHEWLTAWWRHFALAGRFWGDSLSAFVVRDSQAELVGFLPMMLTQRPAFGPVRTRALRFLGADPNISEIRLAIVADDMGALVGRAMGRHLRSIEGWDWIQWTGLVRDSPFASALESELGLEWGAELPGYVLRLPDNWDEFRRGQTRHVKKSLRHCYRSLERDGLHADLTIAETPESMQPALQIFFRLHRLRAHAKNMVPHPDTFLTKASQMFLTDVMTQLAERGIAKIFSLSVGNEVVACRVVFRLPDCVYLYYSGYDQEWSKYSVMTTTVAEIIKYAIDHRISTVHLSTGKDSSKTRWCPEEVLLHEAYTVRPTAFSHLALRAYKLARKGRFGAIRQQLRFLPSAVLVLAHYLS
jgi:CelD/BcsL family acetyltransferase involved in cellulose biosynthesis